MADENLLHSFTPAQLVDHLQRVLHRAVQCRVTTVDDCSGGVHVFSLFLRAIQADVVVHLKWQAEWVHLLVTFPAIVLSGDAHAVAEGFLRLVR